MGHSRSPENMSHQEAKLLCVYIWLNLYALNTDSIACMIFALAEDGSTVDLLAIAIRVEMNRSSTSSSVGAFLAHWQNCWNSWMFQLFQKLSLRIRRRWATAIFASDL